MIAATIGIGCFAAERAIYHFNRPFIQPRTYRDATDFALEHRFELVGGVAASAVLGSVLYVARDPYKTASEKFMSVRLFSQAAGLMALLGAVGAGALYAQRKRHLEAEEEGKEEEEVVLVGKK